MFESAASDRGLAASGRGAAAFQLALAQRAQCIRLHTAGDGATEGNPRANYVAGLCPTPAF